MKVIIQSDEADTRSGHANLHNKKGKRALVFSKGHKAWNKGKEFPGTGPWKGKKRQPFSEEWKKNMSEALKKGG